MSFNGNAYAVFTVNGDVRRRAPGPHRRNFIGLTGALDTAQGDTAGVGTGRPKRRGLGRRHRRRRVGRAGHVYARRVFNTTPSTAVLDLNLADLEGHPGGTADAARRRHRGRLVVRVGRVPPAVRQRRRRARAIGVRLRGSRTDPPVAYDGLGWGGAAADAPRVDINGKGVGVSTAGAATAPRCRRSSRTTS